MTTDLAKFAEDISLRAAMGNEFSAAYQKQKQQEWSDFTSRFSQWACDNTLDINS